VAREDIIKDAASPPRGRSNLHLTDHFPIDGRAPRPENIWVKSNKYFECIKSETNLNRWKFFVCNSKFSENTRFNTLINTGASRSCVSSNFVKQLKLKPKPIKTGDARVLFSADNNAIQTEGTADIDVKIQGLVIPFEFTVIQKMSQKLTIGLDLLNASHAKIDLEDKTVTFCDLVALPLETSKQQFFFFELS
jgi:hypothetical protein